MNSIKKIMGSEYKAYLENLSKPPVKSFRINTLKQSVGDFLKLCPMPLQPAAFSDEGLVYDSEVFLAALSPFHDAGFYYLMDASHFAGIELLRPFVGKRVLDLCAAPGGTACALAGIMKNEGVLVANDIEYNRAKVLSSNIERMGITNSLVTSNSPKFFEKEFAEWFDTVIVDAPCSGEGGFRSTDMTDIISNGGIGRWSEKGVATCFARQYEILSSAAETLRVGGYLLYTTTALNVTENEEIINRFILTHDFEIVPVPPSLKDKVRSGFGVDAIRIFPQDGSEGYFACLMRKIDGYEDNEYEFCYYPPPHPQIGDEAGNILQEFTIANYGELRHRDYSLVAYTENLPLKAGMNVLRAGLNVISLTPNGIMPAHALAMTMNQNISLNNLDYTFTAPQIREFLAGGIINATTPYEGWGTISLSGNCIGVIECRDGQIKSHHPRGLKFFIK